jgi:hypothetical protein
MIRFHDLLRLGRTAETLRRRDVSNDRSLPREIPMFHHRIAGLGRAFVVAALVAAPRMATAQEPVVWSSGGGTIRQTLSSASMPDSLVRELIRAHVGDALLDDADGHHVVLVVDANNQYLSSKVSKMAVISRSSVGDTAIFLPGGEAAGGRMGVMLRRVGVGELADGGSSVVFMRSATGEGSGEGGFMGTGYALADIGSFTMKRYAAGDLSKGLLTVSIAKLR